MQGMCNKKILQTYLDILGGYMGKKRYTLENLSELKIEKEEITVEDNKTGKEKTQKEVADELRNITKLYIKTRKENNK